MNQAFRTIVLNALEALDGSGQLTVAITRREAGVAVQIRDDGPGLSEVDRAQIFDLGLVAKEGRIGLGLGLPLALRAVESDSDPKRSGPRVR